MPTRKPNATLGHNKVPKELNSPQEYISPKELAKRWSCSRSSVDRYARNAGVRRLVLGAGANSSVRYLWSDVLEFERKRTV